MVEVVPDPPDDNGDNGEDTTVDIDPMDLKVQYGQRSLGEEGYVLKDSVSGTVVFQSESKSEVIEQAQLFKGFTPTDGNESTYALQLAGAAGEQPVSEMIAVRTALTQAVFLSLTDFFTNGLPGMGDSVLSEYEFGLTQRGDTAVSVAVTHESRWPMTFTINTSGSVTRPNQ